MEATEKTARKGSLLRWTLLGAIIVLLGAGVYLGHKQYRHYQENKVYSVGETINFPGFTFVVEKADFKPVNLELNQEAIKEYGGMDKNENCAQFSKRGSWVKVMGEYMDAGISPQTRCENRNMIRESALKYMSENKQLVVDYRIKSDGVISPSNIRISLTPDSGRDVKKIDKGCLYIFHKDARESFWTPPGSPGATYELSGETCYTPYNSSDLGGDINKGLERTGYTYTDIRNSEKSVDVKVTYKDQTRLVRINR